MAFITDSDHADHYASVQQKKLDRARRRSRSEFRHAKRQLLDQQSADELDDLDLLPQHSYEPEFFPRGWDRVEQQQIGTMTPHSRQHCTANPAPSRLEDH